MAVCAPRLIRPRLLCPQQARHVEAAVGGGVRPAQAGAGAVLPRNHHAGAVPAVRARHQCENRRELPLCASPPFQPPPLLVQPNPDIHLHASDLPPASRTSATRCDSVSPRSSIEDCAACACLRSTWPCLPCAPRTR